MADGSFRYANRDSSTKAQKYTDIALVPCDKNHQSDKEKAQIATAIVAANTDIRLGLERVSVADDGAATITFKDGSTKVIPAESLVEKLKKPDHPDQPGNDHRNPEALVQPNQPDQPGQPDNNGEKPAENKAETPTTSDQFDGGVLAALASSTFAAVSGAFGIKRKKKVRKYIK